MAEIGRAPRGNSGVIQVDAPEAGRGGDIANEDQLYRAMREAVNGLEAGTGRSLSAPIPPNSPEAKGRVQSYICNMELPPDAAFKDSPYAGYAKAQLEALKRQIDAACKAGAKKGEPEP